MNIPTLEIDIGNLVFEDYESGINEITSCIICLDENNTNKLICPLEEDKCQARCCKKCEKKLLSWIRTNKSCPHCRGRLTTNIINIYATHNIIPDNLTEIIFPIETSNNDNFDCIKKVIRCLNIIYFIILILSMFYLDKLYPFIVITLSLFVTFTMINTMLCMLCNNFNNVNEFQILSNISFIFGFIIMITLIMIDRKWMLFTGLAFFNCYLLIVPFTLNVN